MRLLDRSLAACLILTAACTVGCQASPPIASPPSSQPATQGAFPPGESLASTIPEGAQHVTALAASRKLAYSMPEQGNTTGIWQIEVGKFRQRVGELKDPIEGLQWSGNGYSLFVTGRRSLTALPHEIYRIQLSDAYPGSEFQDQFPLRVIPAPRGDAFAVLRVASDTKLIQPVFSTGVPEPGPRTPQADWLTWSADGRRVAYTSTDEAPAGQVALWASSGSRLNGVWLATIAPVEGMFWQGGDRLAVWRMTRSNGHDTELVIQSYPTLGGEATETRIPMTDSATGQGYVHTAITATPDGSRLLMRRQTPEQSVLVSIAERRVVAQGPAMSFHGWMVGDTFLASTPGAQGPRYFMQSLPPAPVVSTLPTTPGTPAQDPTLPFSYEFLPGKTPVTPSLDEVEVGGGKRRFTPLSLQVHLRTQADLPGVLEKYGTTVQRTWEFMGRPQYVMTIDPSRVDTEDLTPFQALGSAAGLRNHYVFASRAGAVLYLTTLRMQADHGAGIERAYVDDYSPIRF